MNQFGGYEGSEDNDALLATLIPRIGVQARAVLRDVGDAALVGLLAAHAHRKHGARFLVGASMKPITFNAIAHEDIAAGAHVQLELEPETGRVIVRNFRVDDLRAAVTEELHKMFSELGSPQQGEER